MSNLVIVIISQSSIILANYFLSWIAELKKNLVDIFFTYPKNGSILFIYFGWNLNWFQQTNKVVLYCRYPSIGLMNGWKVIKGCTPKLSIYVNPVECMIMLLQNYVCIIVELSLFNNTIYANITVCVHYCHNMPKLYQV